MGKSIGLPLTILRRNTYAQVFTVLLLLSASACGESSPHGAGDPKEIVGTWRALQGETIRVYENNTYSIDCGSGVSDGIVVNRSKYGARLKNFECLSQGRICAQNWGTDLSTCNTDNDPAADLEIRVNYLKPRCGHDYCFEWGDYESGAASKFAKISDDTEAE